MFNAVTYFEDLKNKLVITKDAYHFCRVTGLNYLEDVLMNIKKNAFLAVDDTDDGVTIRKGAGFFNRRAIVIYILKKYDIKSQIDRETKLNETRTIRAKLQAKLIKDSNDVEDLMYLDKTRMSYKEVPGFFSVGTCGVYLIITIEEPVDLTINQDDWIS